MLTLSKNLACNLSKRSIGRKKSDIKQITSIYCKLTCNKIKILKIFSPNPHYVHLKHLRKCKKPVFVSIGEVIRNGVHESSYREPNEKK